MRIFLALARSTLTARHFSYAEMAYRNSRGRGARSAPYESYGGSDGVTVYVGNLPYDCEQQTGEP